MKFVEITVNDIKTNLKRNRRIMIFILIVCIVIGSISGFVFAKTYSPIKNSNTEEQPKLELSEIEKDASYYYKSFMVINEKMVYLEAYLQCLQRINLSEESKIMLNLLKDSVDEYQDKYEDAETFYYNEAPFTYEQRAETITFYEAEIAKFQKYKKEQEVKLESDKNNSNIAEHIVKAQERVDMLNAHIDIINNRNQKQAEEIANEADAVLQENYKEINSVIELFNNTMREIEDTDNYEVLYYEDVFNDYYVDVQLLATGDLEKETILNDKKNQAIIYARSVEGVDIRKERFAATLTFFLMFGVCISLITGMFYHRKKGK